MNDTALIEQLTAQKTQLEALLYEHMELTTKASRAMSDLLFTFSKKSRIVEGLPVQYVAYTGRSLAAIVIGVNPLAQTVDLVVFTNMENVNGVKNFGTQFH